MITNQIQNLKSEIENYIKNGGDIYAPRRTLPYYDKLRYLKRILEKKSGQELSTEFIYALCDIDFDRARHNLEIEYQKFNDFLYQLSQFADEQGYVDIIRDARVRSIDDTYYKLKLFADKYKSSPFDFLVLMTPYAFKEAIIPLDYIEFTKQELQRNYPDGDLEGIRHGNPELYAKLKTIRQAIPESFSMDDLADFLGCYNDRFYSTKYRTAVNEAEVLEKLNQLFPNKDASDLRVLDHQLYRHIIALSVSRDQTVYQWLESNNFTYRHRLNTPRLSKAKIDTEKRTQLLLQLKTKALEKYDLSTKDELKLFSAHLSAAQDVIKYLNENNIIYSIPNDDEDPDIGEPNA